MERVKDRATVGAYMNEWEGDVISDGERVVMQTLMGLAQEIPIETYWEAESRFRGMNELYRAYGQKKLKDSLSGLEERTTNKGVEVYHQMTGVKASGANSWQAKENLVKTFEMMFAGLRKRGVEEEDVAATAELVFKAIEHDLYGSGR